MTTGDQMRLGVIAAATVVGVGLAAAIGNGDNPQGPKRGEFFQTAVQLRSMGVDAGSARQAMRTATGAADADVADVVTKSYGRSGRDAASLRTQLVTLVVTDARAFTTWGNKWCEPLTGLPQHQACLDANRVVQGTPMCIAGQPAGWVARVQVTPAMAAKLVPTGILGDAAAQIQAAGLVPCPSE